MVLTPNTVVQSRCGLCSRCFVNEGWVVVKQINDGRILKIFGELSAGKRKLGRRQLRYRDVCKRDMKEVLTKINGMRSPMTVPSGEVICKPS